MAIEKKWTAVPAQTITSNGGSEGQLQVSDATVFFVKQTVTIFSDDLSPIDFQVKRVVDLHNMIVGPTSENINSTSNMAAYLLSDNPMIYAAEQFRPKIPITDIQRAVYQEEPAVALRVIQVDVTGEPVNAGGSGGGLAPDEFDHVHEVYDSDDNIIQYQFFLSGVSVGNINVLYDSDGKVTDYEKA